MSKLTDHRVLIFVGDDYEDMELQYPKYRLREAGAEVVIAGMEQGITHLGKHGYPQIAEAALADCAAEDFTALIVPGGWMPDKLRRYDIVKKITADFNVQEKCIASICHGGWINISADIVRDRRYTGSPGIKDDLINAGAEYRDEAVVVDGHHISSRKPDDLPAFCEAILDLLSD
jgi:protease I